MVKLPVIVYNRDKQSEVLIDTIDLRRNLENEPRRNIRNRKYIRPIALFQAQPRARRTQPPLKNCGRAENAGIPAEHIAIRTADVNELKNVDLLSPECPVRYIITVNALKEGWDCPLPIFWPPCQQDQSGRCGADSGTDSPPAPYLPAHPACAEYVLCAHIFRQF